jgi:predicted Zn-ribbon and HTH transcriptional regulator
MMNKKAEIFTQFQNLQTQLSNLWLTIQEVIPDESLTNTPKLPLRNIRSFSSKDTWHDQIKFVLEEKRKPMTAREIAKELERLRSENIDDIIDRVNTNCRTARNAGEIGFIPNYPASRRGKYVSLDWESGEKKLHRSNSNGFEKFKKWLPKNGVVSAVDTYISRLRMIENELEISLSNMDREDLENAIGRINNSTCKGMTLGTLSDMRSALRKYIQFLDTQRRS